MHFIQRVVDFTLRLLEVLIFARVIMSWIPVPRDNQVLNKFIKITYQITEPLLAPIRALTDKLFDKLFNGRSVRLDLSPIVLLLLIEVVRAVVTVIFYRIYF